MISPRLLAPCISSSKSPYDLRPNRPQNGRTHTPQRSAQTVVRLAFERKQVDVLIRELSGDLSRQTQALRIMLDIFQIETKAFEGVDAGVLDVLLFILTRSQDVGLKRMICECIQLLCKFPIGRKPFVADNLKLQDLLKLWGESDYDSKHSLLQIYPDCLGLLLLMLHEQFDLLCLLFLREYFQERYQYLHVQ